MKLRTALPSLFVSLLAVPAFAQTPQSTTTEEEDRLPLNFATPADEWYQPKSTISFGYRVLSSGINVNFGNLGNVPSIQTLVTSNDLTVGRVYDNGFVAADAARPTEVDSSGNQTSTPGGRYTTTGTRADGTTFVNGDFLSYTPGLTRAWGYNTASQVQGGRVGMSNFSATSEGATAEAEQGVSGGVEMQMSRNFGKIGKRVEWSISAGVALNDINAKTNGTVRSTLHTHTDYYSLNGRPAPTAPYTGPSFTDLTDSSGTVISTGGLETTTPISALPTPGQSTDTSAAGAASVQGNWQIKGAYFMLRLGPTLRAQINDRFGVSASLGVAGAYSGSRYSVVEQIELVDVNEPVTTIEESTQNKFLPGFYADVNLEWMANNRTGLFGGVSVQNFGDYNQSVGGRTAKIELGNAVGLRGGISIKF
jgi:hypothetical protein